MKGKLFYMCMYVRAYVCVCVCVCVRAYDVRMAFKLDRYRKAEIDR